MPARTFYPVSPEALRDVWAAVTRCPQASMRDLMRQSGRGCGTVHHALTWPEAAGYVVTARSGRYRVSSSRVVLVPLITGARVGRA